MGMSASQARLLSITSRLTNNEFRAQTITNSKLRLASESEDASRQYMDALEAKKLVYGVYDDNGDRVYTKLTANLLLGYGDLKNQYNLVNSSGQILLNGSDIKKYKESRTLDEFMDKYGIGRITVDSAYYINDLQAIAGSDYREVLGNNISNVSDVQTKLGGYLDVLETKSNAIIESFNSFPETYSEYNDLLNNLVQSTDGTELPVDFLGGSGVSDLGGELGTFFATMSTPPQWTFGDKPVMEEIAKIDPPDFETVVNNYGISEFEEYVKGSQDDNVNIGHMEQILAALIWGQNGFASAVAIENSEETEESTPASDDAGSDVNVVENSDGTEESAPASDDAGSDVNVVENSDGTEENAPASEDAGSDANIVENTGGTGENAPASEDTEKNVSLTIKNSDGTIEIATTSKDTETNVSLTDSMFESTEISKNLAAALSIWNSYDCVNEIRQLIIDLYCDIVNTLNKSGCVDLQDSNNASLNSSRYSINKSEKDVSDFDDLYERWDGICEKLNSLQETINSESDATYLVQCAAVETQYENDVANWENKYKTFQAQVSNWTNSFEGLKASIATTIAGLGSPTIEIHDTKDARYQWYLNLWERMGAGKRDASGNVDTGAFKELDANLINNAEWLEFALAHGIITLEQATFKEDGSITYPNMGQYDWVAKPYTSASDIVSQDDEVAIAIAEAKYQKTIKEIENKDKKYDQDLKKLDTEHNALQTEYESVKEVISKNAERTFKVFS